MISLSLIEDGIDPFLLLLAHSGGQEVARMYLCKDDFNGLMNVREQAVIVTAIRIAADLKTAGASNWSAAATFLDGIEDAAAFAASLGYNLNDWLV
jgi:hypothetical protein